MEMGESVQGGQFGVRLRVAAFERADLSAHDNLAQAHYPSICHIIVSGDKSPLTKALTSQRTPNLGTSAPFRCL